jgi:putative tryptophan/tyrosine transport system substrate-binding protein
MKRREFIGLLAGAATAWPLGARAQQNNHVRRIGFLMSSAETDTVAQSRVAAFREGLQQLGWTEGRNIRIDYRWAGDFGRIRSYAEELVRLSPDVMVANGNPVVAAVLQQTRTVPIVFVQVADPVGSGFIQSLARPGGNITGLTNFELSMAGKWLELLKEIAPTLTRVAVILHPETAAHVAFLRVIQAMAPSVGVALTVAGVHDAVEIEGALTTFAAGANGGVIVLPHPVTGNHRDVIIRLAQRGHLPTIAPFEYFAVDGTLMSYGVDSRDLFRRAGSYVDRILKGENPGDLPVQGPTKFEFVINMKAAKALGLTVPPSILLRADEVIE